jgi:hypothetical protein
MESFHPPHLGVVGGDWHLDADPLEYLELRPHA